MSVIAEQLQCTMLTQALESVNVAIEKAASRYDSALCNGLGLSVALMMETYGVPELKAHRAALIERILLLTKPG